MLIGTILAASLVAAEKVRTAQDVFKEVNGRLEREFISAEGLLLDYVGDIPEAKEIAELGPNAMGWWTPIENGSRFIGEWLPAGPEYPSAHKRVECGSDVGAARLPGSDEAAYACASALVGMRPARSR